MITVDKDEAATGTCQEASAARLLPHHSRYNHIGCSPHRPTGDPEPRWRVSTSTSEPVTVTHRGDWLIKTFPNNTQFIRSRLMDWNFKISLCRSQRLHLCLITLIDELRSLCPFPSLSIHPFLCSYCLLVSISQNLSSWTENLLKPFDLIFSSAPPNNLQSALLFARAVVKLVNWSEFRG